MWNYTNEVSGAQVFLSAQVCGSRFLTLPRQTFLDSMQNTCTELHQCSAKGLTGDSWEPTYLYILSKMGDKDQHANTSGTTAESYKLDGSKF